MIQIGRKILFWLSAMTLLLHNLVPHRHRNELSAAEICYPSQQADWLALLRSVFQTDLGAEHLQNFEISKKQWTIASAIIHKNAFPNILHIVFFNSKIHRKHCQKNIKHLFQQTFQHFQLIYLAHRIMRAPPYFLNFIKSF